MRTKFKNANEAYEYFHNEIIINGIDFSNTKALFNVGFTLEDPEDYAIHSEERKFNTVYAEAEWEWYMSGDPSIEKLGEIYGKIPPIWKRMADIFGNVNSNYGYQWKRNNQIGNVAKMLKDNPNRVLDKWLVMPIPHVKYMSMVIYLYYLQLKLIQSL